jgi:hypothetical protein
VRDEADQAGYIVERVLSSCCCVAVEKLRVV